MASFRGFKLARRVRTLCRRALRSRTRHFRRLNPPDWRIRSSAAVARIWRWGHRLKVRAKTALCSAPKPRLGGILPGPGYIPIGDGVGEEKAEAVPKGHLAVYVGKKDGDCERVLVPVVYFNHPLFGELLREAEEEYGFHHPGGITIPCRISEFQSVQTKIAAVRGGGRSKPF